MECVKHASGYRSRDQFLRVLRSQIEGLRISLDQRVLVVGGSSEDEEVLRRAGFEQIVNSNLPSDVDRMNAGGSAAGATHIALDAEQINMPNDSFDLVFAHEVLHHCSSPHRALCEMLRVSRRYVLFLEPNDSLTMAFLVRMRFSFPYELPAVVDHHYRSGGVRDSQIPNFIHRWTEREVLKTVSSFIPERVFSVRAYPYWDFSLTEESMDARKETRLGIITLAIGTANFLTLLGLAQLFLNRLPIVRSQGNKLFCCVEKSPGLKPWLAREGGEIVLDRRFSRALGSGEAGASSGTARMVAPRGGAQHDAKA